MCDCTGKVLNRLCILHMTWHTEVSAQGRD